ncbi:MAG: type IV pilin protein [Pseudomonadota bacterium]
MTTFHSMLAPRPRRGMHGVSLIELMVVVFVIGIMTTIAVPSYRRYMLRSQRSEAKIALLQLQTAQEKRYLQMNAYTNDVTGAVTANPPGLGLLATSETQKYDITVSTFAADGQTYTATATPKLGQSDDADCKNFTINERGVRGISGTKTPEICWK